MPRYLGRVLDEDGSPVGTCFQIAPGVLVTAWHVLKRLGKAAVDAQVAIDPLAGGAAAEAAVKRLDKAHDLAVLACDVPLAASAGNLAATDQVAASADVTVTGHGVIDGSGRVLRSLRTIGRWAGPVMWEDSTPAARMTAEALLPGMSGAPVIRQSDGTVVRVVSGRYNSADGWLAQTVWVTRSEDLVTLLEGITDIQLLRVPAPGELDPGVLARLRRETHGHFGPRAMGVDHSGEPGDYFTARTTALREIGAWLRNPQHDLMARVVTGNPGSGKSALLGRILLGHGTTPTASPDPPQDDPVIPADMPVVALHARRTTLTTLVTKLGEAIGRPGCDLDQILETLAARSDPLVVVFDSLDEAGTAGSADRPEIAGSAAEVRRIAGHLLQPLSVLPQVRLIVGTRRINAGGHHAELTVLGRAITVLDLDVPTYLNRGDLAEYAYALLRAEQDPVSRSPYRESPALAREVADAIATRAGTSFLVARMTARALVRGQILIDTSVADWQQSLPSDAAQALDADLDRYGTERPKLERLLRPLAYAQGPGLPWSTLWAPLATALSGVKCTDDDVEWLQRHAGAYLVEATDETGSSAYRLFHETMAEHLRRPGRNREIHTIITDTLLGQIPKATGRTDPAERAWDAASTYVRRHLAEHAAAAAGKTLDRLLEDPGFLVYADPASLFPALPAATTATGQATASLYRTSGHSHLDPASRRQILAIDAARRRHPLVSALNDTLTWRVRWATGTLIHPAQRLVLTGHADEVHAVGCTLWGAR